MASVQLIERQGGIVAGICAVNIEENQVTTELRANYKCISVANIGKDILPRLRSLSDTPNIVKYTNSRL